MKKIRFYSYGLIAAGMVLLSVLGLPDIAGAASDEQVGITVSYAPDPGWVAYQSSAGSRSGTMSRNVIFISVGGVLLLAVCAKIFLFKKRGSSSAVLSKKSSTRPATKSVSKTQAPRPEPKPIERVTPEPKPTERVFPLSQQPAVPPKPVVIPAAQPAPVLASEPPSPASPPKAVQPSSVSSSLPDEEDSLFAHLDLLKKLKAKGEL